MSKKKTISIIFKGKKATNIVKEIRNFPLFKEMRRNIFIIKN